MVDEHALTLRIHDEVFRRAEQILVCTETERQAMLDHLGSDSVDRLRNIGFTIGVNSLARSTEPHDYDGRSYIVVARDWTRTASVEHFIRWSHHLERQIDTDLQLRLVGPGAERLPLGIRLTASHLDVWRWMHRAICVLDPSPQRLLGREVLEAMLLSTPVVVNASGGATREHAQRGNGGLWYRTDDELYGVVAALLDRKVHDSLGEQGRAYAEENFSDTYGYVKTVTEAILR
jgi:glycosyltransferase involved in cell wall biosynthesis